MREPTPRKLPSGNWRIQFALAGQRHSKTFPLRRQCVDYYREVATDARKGRFIAPDKERTPVGERLDAWLDHKEADPDFGGHDGHGLRVYRSTVDCHIRPYLGEMEMAQVTIEVVERWRNELVAEKGSATARRSFRVLSSFLTDQQRHGYAHDNVAKLVDPPSHSPRRMVILEPHELDVVVDQLGGDTWQADIVLGLVFVGCRVGDFSRLRPTDWDRINGRLFVRDSKTGNDRHLPVFDELEAVLVRASERGGPRLFMTDGLHGQAVLRSSAFAKRHFKPALDAAGIGKSVRVHDLRHSCASWLIRQGFGPVHVAAYLGHRNPATTMRTYSHLFADDFADMGEALDELWRMRNRSSVTRLRRAE